MDSVASEGKTQSHPRRSGVPSRLAVSVAAAILMTVSGAAIAQPQQRTTGEFSLERRDALRQMWRTDPAIRDHVEPGDDARRDAHSDFYSADYNGRTSLAPMLALQPHLPVVAVAVATTTD